MENGKILVVTLPARVDLADSRELRADILEGLAQGVLILPEAVRWSVEDMPALSGVSVLPRGIPETAEEEKVMSPLLLREKDIPGYMELSEAEEKRAVVQRLKGYREKHGLGCLEDVSRATRTRGRISASVLRDAVNGAAALSIGDWRKIGQALERCETMERTKAEKPEEK